MSLVALKPAHQCSTDDRFETVRDLHAAQAILRGYRGDSVAMHRLRELLASVDQNVFRHDDSTVLAVAAAKIVKGEFRVRRDPCERRDERNRRYVDWIRKYQADAIDIAASLQTSVQNILGLAAFESDFGRTESATFANNFFALSTTKQQPLPGQLGLIMNQADPNVGTAKFKDFLTSAKAFAQTKGQLIRGETDPKAFASILQNRGKFGIAVRGPLRTYVEDLCKVIHEIEIRLHCA